MNASATHAPATMTLPSKARIVEVGPRDGLQNEKQPVTTATKIELIARLADCGLTAIEATAFVSPKWVPQMADAAAVMAGVERRAGVSYPVLVPNAKGLESAIAAQAAEVAVFAAASEAFSQKNINCTIKESLERFKPVMVRAREAGIKVRGYVSCVLGCPYQGEVAPTVVAEVAWALFDMGCYEVSLGDTIGTGTPGKTKAMIEAAAPRATQKAATTTTPSAAIANIYASLQMGVVSPTAVGGQRPRMPRASATWRPKTWSGYCRTRYRVRRRSTGLCPRRGFPASSVAT
jgi:hydroxymethylglutaryl-CoA lyase